MISKNSGFSLIEILVATLLISVAFVSIVRLQAYVEVKSERTDLQYEAVRLAEEQIMLWQNVGANVDCNGTVKLITLANLETCTIDFSPLSGTVLVGTTKTDSSGNLLMKNLTVKVDWTDRSGETGSISLVSGHSVYSPLLR